MSNNGLPVTDVVGVSVTLGQRRTAGASAGDAYAQAAQGSAVSAANSAAKASQAELGAVEAADGVAENAVIATDAATKAEAAAENAQNIADANTYHITPSDPDGTIAGIAGTESGKYFRVAQGISSDTAFIYYLNDNGVAIPVSALTGEAAIQRMSMEVDSVKRMTGEITPKQNIVPIAYDDAGNIPIWLIDGDLDAKGVSDQFASKLDGRVIAKGLDEGEYKNTLTPLAQDDAGNVPVWLDNGNLDAKGFGPKLQQKIQETNVDAFQPREAPIGSTLPISTDGRTLYSTAALISKIIHGESKQLKILMTGDSWCEYVAIPQAIFDLCQRDYSAAWSSYISVNGQFMLTGTSFTKSPGWTMYDASLKPNWPPVNGCGPDGQSATTTASDQTMSLTASCDEIRLLHQDLSGAFRYRLDGGAWTTITGSNTGQSLITKTSVSTLGVHTLEIDTTVNTGLVGINGFYCPSKTKAGVEVIKAGNAGITGDGLDNFKDNIPQFSNLIKPDLMIFILGTNDFRNGRTVESFKAGLRNHIKAWRSSNPNMGCVLVIPARCSANGPNPSTVYRDASAEVAFEFGVEWYNFHDDWSTWAVMNTFGVWVDGLHLNDAGATAFAKTINHRFLAK
ncbi:SGNH/GDSL hydrolase family protein [Serratia marcescens]|uniref:SGNH/GDSL hydrolase family protein n=1 Tax=Serratia marcescens TaxID=615 RepID=UPI00274F0334|nr:SGNH/GDSL hydrolase family protein [Serratia marcescens]MDP8650114.1 SGNH/GDSL hydrolase family protein [Serratia marcescens]MDP8664967.1 SGNH/GDSL hydrolase family protein [Serratia marcescens]MDP8739098.1 SGNH/GDSL hydrolase family protein [Serratia marcescens]MDP8813584.1 SGNH/GDSL hydrolase family protein [Serratia marcescens]HEJ7160082.1 SGNH/GDSL hydrolase family protein [Serratia marcescens]